MTIRERNLAIGVVGALVLFGGYGFVQSAVIAPRAQLSKELNDERTRAGSQETREGDQKITFAAWEKQMRRTLGVDADKVSGNFRDDVSDLLKKHKLTRDLTISPRDARIVQKSIRKGFSELSLQVSVKGSLENLVEFLDDFYRRPYQKRVTRLSLGLEGGAGSAMAEPKAGKGAKGAAAARPEPVLNISMTLTTLMLPRIENKDWKALKQPTFDPKNPGETPPDALASELPEYAKISKPNPFEMYVEQKTVVQVTSKSVEGEHRPPPPPPPPPRPNHVLVYTTSLDGAPVAFVDESGKKTSAPVEKHLNEKVDDGMLVLVHPQGMVVRTHPRGGGDPKYYFYPLGASFKDRIEAPEFDADYPDVARALHQTVNF